jgi:hypothetical protein
MCLTVSTKVITCQLSHQLSEELSNFDLTFSSSGKDQKAAHYIIFSGSFLNQKQ